MWDAFINTHEAIWHDTVLSFLSYLGFSHVSMKIVLLGLDKKNVKHIMLIRILIIPTKVTLIPVG